MHNERPAARRQRASSKPKDGEVLSPIEATALARGQILKRVVRAAAAMNDLFDDASIGQEVGVGRGAVGHWWNGSKPAGETIFRLAHVTGLSPDELTRFAYSDGPPPTLPDPASPVVASVQEGLRQDQSDPQHADPDTPAPSPERPLRGTGAGRG